MDITQKNKTKSTGLLWSVFILIMLLYMPAVTWASDFGTARPVGEAEPGGQVNPSCPNANGAPSSEGKPIRLFDGRETHRVTDLIVSGRIPINLSRKYDSRATYDSTLGYGWAFSFDRRLYEYPDGSIIRRTDCGRRDRFIFTGGAYVTPADTRGVLTANQDGTYEFQSVSNIIDRYDAEGRLTAIVRENGEHLAFTYDNRGRLPLIGTSPNAVDPNLPMVVARGDRLLRIEARYPDGTPMGNFIDFTYNDTTGRLASIQDNLGQTVTYGHDVLGTGTRGNLTSVVGPNGSSTYVYDDPLDQHNVTSFQDPNDPVAIVLTYDDQDRAITQVYGNKTITITYNIDLTVDTTTVLTNDLGATISTVNKRFEFDALGYVTLYRDGDGREQRVTYHPTLRRPTLQEVWEPGTSGLELIRSTVTTYYTDGSVESKTQRRADTSGGALQTYSSKTYTYDSSIAFIEKTSQITETSVCSGQNKVTTYQYDTAGNTSQIQINGFTPACIPVSRTTNLTYAGPLNQLSLIDGPRADVNDTVILTYYPDSAAEGDNRARVQSITTGTGLILRNNVQYLPTGKMLSESRWNGLDLTYTYYPVDDRLETITQTDGVRTRVTRWTYQSTGEVASITLAEGDAQSQTTLTFGYDPAGRLTRVTDSFGNFVEFTLDAEGNRLSSNTYDSIGTLTTALNQTFDTYDNLTEYSHANENFSYTYDAERKLTRIDDGNGTSATYTYDELKRLISSTQDIGGADLNTADSLTQYTYDVQDNLTTVIDPNNGTTTYVYDDLGNLLSQTSPDTGATTFTYNEAGQVVREINALSQRIDYQYDSLGRILLIDYPNTEQDVTFVYDSYVGCNNGQGRLCFIQDESGTTLYDYDGFGNLLDQTHTELGVNYTTSYTYDLLDRISSTTLPTGRTINNIRDTQGRITTVDTTINSVTTPIVTNMSYNPDGQLADQTFGNGINETRTYDLAGRLETHTIPETIAAIPPTDNQDPTVTAPADILNVEATAVLTPVILDPLGTAMAIDNVDGVLIPTPDQTGSFALGFNIIVWSATDVATNTGMANQTVQVVDTTGPDLLVPSNVTVQSNQPIFVDIGDATATDLFPPITYSNTPDLALYPIGTTLVTWTATDANGNSQNGVQQVTVTPTNALPIADAGAAQTVLEGTLVNLDGSASNDPDGSITSYAWTQTAGPVVTLTNANTISPSFTAPDVPSDSNLLFSLIVTDNNTATDAATVVVTVQDVLPPTPPPTSGFSDDFTRADGSPLGNGWLEKNPSAFVVQGNRIAPQGIGEYRNNLVYRPATENLLDVEASVELQLTATPIGYPELVVRLQTDTANIAGNFTGYLLYIDSNANIAVLNRHGQGGYGTGLATLNLTPALVVGDTYRLRLRAVGTAPVQLDAFVERFNGTDWDVIGQANFSDNDPASIITAGSVGFSGDADTNYLFDNFTRADLSGNASLFPMIELQEYAEVDKDPVPVRLTTTRVEPKTTPVEREPQGTLLSFNLSTTTEKSLPVWYRGPETLNNWVPFTHARQLPHTPATIMMVSEEGMDVWTDQDGKMTHQHVALSVQQKADLMKVHHIAPSLNQVATQSVKTFSYDGNGNVLQIDHSDQGISSYVYDALDRLTVDTQATHAPRNFTYDRIGNRTNTSYETDSVDSTYLPNSNVLDTLAGNTVVHNVIGQRTQDQNGNRSFEYNNANRLMRVIEGGTEIARYTYNALGQRTRKVTPTGTTIYHYDQSGQLISETDAAGNDQRDYVWRNSEPVAQIDVNAGVDTVTYLHVDHLSTPRKGTNQNGELVWSWDSDAFGASVPFGTVEVNLRFPGQYYDLETGLHYNYFRYYDPSTGRYITSDPIGLNGGLNTFGYVGGNPVNWIDPTGEIRFPPVVQRVVAAVAIAIGLSGTPTPNPDDGGKTNPPAGEQRKTAGEREKATKAVKEPTRKPAPRIPPKPIIPSKPFMTPRFPLLICPLCGTLLFDPTGVAGDLTC